MKLTEIVDSPETARKFLTVNKIPQKDIVGIVIIWNEDIK